MMLYILLASAFFLGLTSGRIQKTTTGIIESFIPENKKGIILMTLYFPLAIISNVGTFAVCIWSLFVLKWFMVLGVLFGTLLLWTVICNPVLMRLRHSEVFLSIAVLVALTLEVIMTVMVIVIAWSFIHPNL